MRTPTLLIGVFILAVGMGASAQPQNYPWCAQYSGRALGGAMNCGFVSFEQCMATVSGIGGFCIRNNTYRPLYNSVRPGSAPHASTRHRPQRYPY
jgi:hypothetical protein